MTALVYVLIERKDRMGNSICFKASSKDHSQHKMMFRDKVNKGQALHDLHLVESYKKYNLSTDEEGGDIICKCSVF